MAAGFSIETKMIDKFTKEINNYAKNLLTDEVLQKKLKIDCEVEFEDLTYELLNELSKFDPTGLGNFPPLFCTKGVEVVKTKAVGRESKHLKLKLSHDGKFFDAIYFNSQYTASNIPQFISIAFSLEDNTWNGYKNLQLKIRDMKFDS